MVGDASQQMASLQLMAFLTSIELLLGAGQKHSAAPEAEAGGGGEGSAGPAEEAGIPRVVGPDAVRPGLRGTPL